MLPAVNLATAGYHGDQVPAMQRRMIDAMQTIMAWSRGMVNGYPPLVYLAGTKVSVFKQKPAT